MMMKRTRVLPGILAIAILSSSVFTSCSGKDDPAETESSHDSAKAEDTAASETTAAETGRPDEARSDLPDAYDLEGYELRVIKQSPETLTWLLNTFAPEEATADPLNDEIFRRNSRVCEKYNFKIKETNIEEDPAQTVFKSVQAGDNEYDVTFSMLDEAKKLMQGSVLNLAEVPHINLEKSYWNQQIREELKIDDNIYAMTGDLLLSDDDAMMIMIYNRPLADKNDIENLYETVRAGKWTYDKMLSCIKIVSSDLNNDGVYDFNDRYGLLYGGPSAIQEFFAASDARIYGSSKGVEYPEFLADTERAVDAFSKYNALLSNPALSFDWANLDGAVTDRAAGLANMLNNDQFLFQSIVLSMVRRNYREVTTDFGILVQPKLDENQSSYKTCLSITTPYLFLPGTTDAEKTGFAVEALASESYRLQDTYYQVCMESKYTRDQESFEMIGLAAQNLVFDLGMIYNFGDLFGTFQKNIIKSDAPYSSLIARNKERCDKQMKKMFDQISGK